MNIKFLHILLVSYLTGPCAGLTIPAGQKLLDNNKKSFETVIKAWVNNNPSHNSVAFH